MCTSTAENGPRGYSFRVSFGLPTEAPAAYGWNFKVEFSDAAGHIVLSIVRPSHPFSGSRSGHDTILVPSSRAPRAGFVTRVSLSLDNKEVATVVSPVH